MSKVLRSFSDAELRATVQSVAVSETATQNDKALVAAQAGLRIVVLGYNLATNGGAWTFQFKSGTTDLTGDIPLASGEKDDKSKLGDILFKTAEGEALNADLIRTGGSIEGVILYAYSRV